MKTIHLYLLGGQSNMDGRALSKELPKNLQQPNANISIYINDSWHDLQPGLNHDRNNDWFGPEITFGPEMVEATRQNIVLVKYAIGSTTLGNEWHAPDTQEQGAGSCYTSFIKAVEEAIASLSLGRKVEIKGMIWMQGETDAWHADPAWANAYKQNLTDFIHSIRHKFKEPNLPIVIGRISPSWTWSGGGHGEIVRQAQLEVSRTMLKVAMIDTDDLSLDADEAHYNASGQIELGKRFAKAMISLSIKEGNI
jgi:hypothetical protein